MPDKKDQPDLTAIRARLGSSKGREYWRSLEELADTQAFQELLRREFPSQASEWNDPLGRRKFLKLMGASLALAGLTACTRQPTELIAPYVRQPEDIVPGKPLYYATAMPLSGVGTGLLVESHMGRPTKIEGNPDHPASLGATSLYAQAAVLTLYDPDRSQSLTFLDEIKPWSAFLGAVRPVLATQRAVQGASFRILTETVTSPTIANQIKTLLAQMPSAKWHQYDAAGRGNALEGTRLAFGQYANAIYKFENADVVVSLDSDFLACGPASVRYAREFARKRRLESGKTEMNRLYVAESALTITGAKADHRLPARSGEIEALARAIAAGVGAQTGQAGASQLSGEQAQWVNAVVNDLKQHRGRSVVVAGDFQPPAVHAMAHAMNQALGNVGSAVVYTQPVEANPVDSIASIRELAQDMAAGKVDLLLILGGNPVYSAPADLNFGELMMRVPLKIHLSLYKDETSELCQWHIPEAHFLESWGDVRAYDGTASIIQPLIAPLYGGKTAHEALAAFSDRPERSSYDIVRDYWQTQAVGVRPQSSTPVTTPATGAAQSAGSSGAAQMNEAAAQTTAVPAGAVSTTTPSASPLTTSSGFERFWLKALHDGLIENTAFATKSLSASFAAQAQSNQSPATGDELEIIFRPDPTIYDGQFSNNAWLQELPKPITKLTWDNAAMISPALAGRLGLTNAAGMTGGMIVADVIELQYQGRSVRAAAWVVPGHADNCVTVTLGYGRKRVGKVGAGAGFNANAIRASFAPWFGPGLTIIKTGDTIELATTQLQHLIDVDSLEKREIVRAGTLEEYKKDPRLKEAGAAHGQAHDAERPPSLYPEYEYTGYKWGMAIDLNACTGCSACIVACQSENNIPVVGKEQVMRSREMHWLRVDSYFKGDVENPETYFQPVPCMHCEKAPCEVVCPVAATVHSAEGLNDMVYNRCVGTRYCSNNCPYKVRRFNFLLYQDFVTESLKLMRNPDVSVRSRGVMEKCTYCVQRINKAKIEAEIENRQVRDGEIVTACAAVCPAQAIVFGDINDPESRVAKLKAEPRNYGLLAELGTQPRTSYLAAVRNPNPELEKA